MAKKAKEERKLTWIEVESSQIEAIAWKDDILYARFLNGSTYSYDPVEYDTYQGMLNAESAGSYLNKYIKSDKSINFKRI